MIKTGDIVRIKLLSVAQEPPSELYNIEKFLYKVKQTTYQGKKGDFIVCSKNLFNSDELYLGDEYLHKANIYDLRDYLKFILESDKVYIKFHNDKELDKLIKIISNIYNKPFRLKSMVNHNKGGYVIQNKIIVGLTEHNAIQAGYSIIDFKDLEHIILKVHGRI